jgi:hypothetical protein
MSPREENSKVVEYTEIYAWGGKFSNILIKFSEF